MRQQQRDRNCIYSCPKQWNQMYHCTCASTAVWSITFINEVNSAFLIILLVWTFLGIVKCRSCHAVLWNTRLSSAWSVCFKNWNYGLCIQLRKQFSVRPQWRFLTQLLFVCIKLKQLLLSAVAIVRLRVNPSVGVNWHLTNWILDWKMKKLAVCCLFSLMKFSTFDW